MRRAWEQHQWRDDRRTTTTQIPTQLKGSGFHISAHPLEGYKNTAIAEKRKKTQKSSLIRKKRYAEIYQPDRKGHFCRDTVPGTPGRPGDFQKIYVIFLKLLFWSLKAAEIQESQITPDPNTLAAPKPGCFTPCGLQFLRGNALLRPFALFCALLRTCICVILCIFACFCIRPQLEI